MGSYFGLIKFMTERLNVYTETFLVKGDNSLRQCFVIKVRKIFVLHVNKTLLLVPICVLI